MKTKTFPFLILSLFLASCDFSFPGLSSEKKTDSVTTSSVASDMTEKNTESFSASSNSEKVTERNDGPDTDPYVNMSETAFYKNYVPATSYKDSQYRTLHHFMSGSIESQKQRPTIAENPPMEDGKYVFNANSGLSADGLSYDIVDKTGKVVNTIYKGGAYVILEEVAAYLYAFGDIPANYSESKKLKPSNSEWGKYLRLNHSYFSCDTDRYKYEPVLPDLNDKKYYEIDIGTTGSYEYSTVSNKGEYNNGQTIIRGASRIVYTRQYKSGRAITEVSERKVFYTFNHYNDFQEYLNYENGWGKWFGNISGGGTMDNDTAIYKTAYPEVIKKEF